MPAERSAGAVIFRDTKDGRKYLLLRHPDRMGNKSRSPLKGHWDFPKGHIESGEKTVETVRREIKEETGIARFNFVPGFKRTIRYFVGPKENRRPKFVYFFLGKTAQRRIHISHEHQSFVWLPYGEAYKRITYSNSRKILKHAHDFLQRKGI